MRRRGLCQSDNLCPHSGKTMLTTSHVSFHSTEGCSLSFIYVRLLYTFRVLMANISQALSTENLKSIKFLLSTTLTRENLEKSKVSHHMTRMWLIPECVGGRVPVSLSPWHKGHFHFIRVSWMWSLNWRCWIWFRPRGLTLWRIV